MRKSSVLSFRSRVSRSKSTRHSIRARTHGRLGCCNGCSCLTHAKKEYQVWLLDKIIFCFLFSPQLSSLVDTIWVPSGCTTGSWPNDYFLFDPGASWRCEIGLWSIGFLPSWAQPAYRLDLRNGFNQGWLWALNSMPHQITPRSCPLASYFSPLLT